MTTDDELEAILQRMNGSFYQQICALAERYIGEKLSFDELCPIDPDEPVGLHKMSSTQTIIASLFIRTCRDFLLRDSGPKSVNQERDAETLKAALKVLQNDMRFFESLMVGVDDARRAITVDAPAGQPGSVSIMSPSARQALWAIHEMASFFEQTAADVGKDRKNITLVHCLKRQFSDLGAYYYCGAPLPLPSVEQVLALHDVLRNAISEALPGNKRGTMIQFLADLKVDKRQVAQHMNYKIR